MKKKVLNGKKTLTNDLIDIVADKVQTKGETILEIPLEKIRIKKNIRTNYIEEKIIEMAKSIKEKGLLQPITVMQTKDGYFDVLFGHRRYKGMLYLHTNEPDKYLKIKCIVKDETEFNEDEILDIQIIENIQREDLTAFELKTGLEHFKQKGMTYKQIAEKIGKTEGFVKNAFSSIKAINQSEELKDLVKSNAGVTLADMQEVKVLPSKNQIELITQKIEGKIKNREQLRQRVWQIKEELSGENKEYRQHREEEKYTILNHSVKYKGFKVKSFHLNEEELNFNEAKRLKEQVEIVLEKLYEIMKAKKGGKSDRNK